MKPRMSCVCTLGPQPPGGWTLFSFLARLLWHLDRMGDGSQSPSIKASQRPR